MPPTQAESYRCPWCNGPYLAMPQPGVMRPPHPDCPALPYPPAPPYSYKGEPMPCEDCEQGEHEACMRWLCTCPSSVHFATNRADRIRY